MDVFGFLTLTYLSRARIHFHMSHQCLTGFGFISCSTGGIHQYIRAHLGGDSPNSFSLLCTFAARPFREIFPHCCRLALMPCTFQLSFLRTPRHPEYTPTLTHLDMMHLVLPSALASAAVLPRHLETAYRKHMVWRELRASAPER